MCVDLLNPFHRERHIVVSPLSLQEVRERFERHGRIQCIVCSSTSADTIPDRTTFVARLPEHAGDQFPWIVDGTLVSEDGGTRVVVTMSRCVFGVIVGIIYWTVSVAGAILAFAGGQLGIAVGLVALGLSLAIVELRQSTAGHRLLLKLVGEAAGVPADGSA